jgi:hypothetical protein
VISESSVEQKREPMDKNRIGGIRRRTSEQVIAKSISIKGAGCKSGGCAWKAVELTSGDLWHVPESGLRVEQFTLIVRQKSAAGVFRLLRRPKAQTAGSGK